MVRSVWLVNGEVSVAGEVLVRPVNGEVAGEW